MTHSSKATDLVREFEGCRLTSYQDIGGVWTIGYGHTYGVTANQVCTEEQALAWLNDDLAASDAVVNKYVSVKLTQNQFDALVDFVFNDGAGALETSTLLKMLNSGQSLLASTQFARWDEAKINGKEQEIAGLLRRRLAERDLFLEGM